MQTGCELFIPIPGSSFRGAEIDGCLGCLKTAFFLGFQTAPELEDAEYVFLLAIFSVVFSQELFWVQANILTPVSSTLMFRDLFATVNHAPLKN